MDYSCIIDLDALTIRDCELLNREQGLVVEIDDGRIIKLSREE